MPEPAEQSPPTPALTQELFTQRMLIWKDLMDTCELLLLAGLRHKIGPDGNLDEAYADWVRQDNAQRSREKYAKYRQTSE